MTRPFAWRAPTTFFEPVRCGVRHVKPPFDCRAGRRIRLSDLELSSYVPLAFAPGRRLLQVPHRVFAVLAFWCSRARWPNKLDLAADEVPLGCACSPILFRYSFWQSVAQVAWQSGGPSARGAAELSPIASAGELTRWSGRRIARFKSSAVPFTAAVIAFSADWPSSPRCCGTPRHHVAADPGGWRTGAEGVGLLGILASSP